MTPASESCFAAVARPLRAGALLRLGPGPLSAAWLAPSRGEWAVGLGVAGVGLGEVAWLEPPGATPPGPFFGGWAFDAQRPWPGYDSERWVLPEVVAWWDGEQTWGAAFGASAGAAELHARLDRVEEVEPFTGQLRATADRANPHWRGLVDGALGAIGRGELEKVVVARTVDLQARLDFPERSVLKGLEAQFPQCMTFLVRGRDGSAFVGATPELLLEVKGRDVRTEALAGTAAPGDGQELLASRKDLREHKSVVSGVREALRPFVDGLEISSAPVVKKLANVVHLHTPFTAQLREGVAAMTVARALHPTPAVAGSPRVDAMAWLRAHEGFSRGWYAGVVGVHGPGGTTLGVAIRSALLRGATARVFTGAGIVEGSTADGEWRETELKASTLLSILGVAGG